MTAFWRPWTSQASVDGQTAQDRTQYGGDWFAYLHARGELQEEGRDPTVQEMAGRAGMSRATAFRLRDWVRDIERNLVTGPVQLVDEHPELLDMTLDEVAEWERGRS